uniref:Uncharacterized protein n=1 Tax=Nelumbo nucifera TaxID=4432 RepID=A0A822Z890_NELNU|nr:TPA_asm: hypothetical protein HUJ06_014018 [Nelumbo nucifera]
MKCFVRGVQIFNNTPLGVVPDALKLRLLKTLNNSLAFSNEHRQEDNDICMTTVVDILRMQGINSRSNLVGSLKFPKNGTRLHASGISKWNSILYSKRKPLPLPSPHQRIPRCCLKFPSNEFHLLRIPLTPSYLLGSLASRPFGCHLPLRAGNPKR